MNFKNLKEDNGLYLYDTNCFVTNSCRLYFNVANDLKSIFINRLLRTMFYEDNKVLGKRNDIINAANLLYGLNVNLYNDNIGSKLFLVLSFEYLDEKVVQDNYSKDVYEYISNFINEVNLTKETLEIAKKKVVINIKNSLTNKDYLVNSIYLNKEISKSLVAKLYTNDVDKVNEILDSITLDDIVNCYKNTFTDSSFYKGYVVGKFNEKEYTKLRKTIPYKSKIKELDYQDSFITCKEDTEIENDSFNESILKVSYEYTNHNNKFSKTLSLMLNISAGLLHEILREKYGLVYTSGLDIFSNNNLLYVTAKIDKSKKEETLKAIDEVFALLHDEEKVKYYIDYAKEYYQDKINTLSDDRKIFVGYLDDYIMKNGNASDLFEYYDFICNYDPKDFIKELDTIKKINVFFYKGVK